jgi:hypothetical protein
MPAPCGRHSELATEGTFFQVFSVKSGVNLLGGGRLLFCPELFMLRSRSFFEASVFVYQFLHKKKYFVGARRRSDFFEENYAETGSKRGKARCHRG